MPTERCPKCAAVPKPEYLVCHECGSTLTGVPEQDNDQPALREAWEAMAVAVRGASLQGQPEQPVRDRFLANMPLPHGAAALIDDALECQRFFFDNAIETTVPETRYRACINRLEVLAADDRDLEPKIAVLERQLADHQRRLRRSNLFFGLIFLGAVLVAIGVVWLVVRGVVALLR
jgi:hypothetical protein